MEPRLTAMSSPRPGDAPLLRLWEASGSAGGRARARLLTAGAAARVAVDLMRVDAATIAPPPTPAGRLLREALGHGIGPALVPRLLLSVLKLPATPEEYLRGRPRQAVRTGVRNAGRLGLTVERVLDPGDRLRVFTDLAMAREDFGDGAVLQRTAQVVAEPSSVVQYVSAPQEARVCIAVAVVAGWWAYLTHLTSRPGAAPRSEARYLIHTRLVEVSIARGVDELWADGPLTTPPGVQQFQRRLGYECARPRVGWRREVRP
jgi:hypothetical protein